jgi:uncharacterized protein
MPVLTRYLSRFELDENNIFLVNSLSGALDLVDRDTDKKIEMIKSTQKINHLDDELLANLKERGYLFDVKQDEDAILDRLNALRIKSVDKSIVMFVICPTTFCNLRCTYCFESEEVKSNPNVINDEQVENICKHIKQILHERKPDQSYIELFGGEPLLPSTLEVNKKIFKFAKENKLFISIISNGTHIKEYKELFEEYKDTVISLQITMDGTKEFHDKRRIKIDKSGTFDIISQGIDILLNIGISVRLRVNVDSSNVENLKTFEDYMVEKGWNQFKNFGSDVAPVTDHHGKGEIDDLMEEHKIVKKIKEIYPEDENKRAFFNLSMFRILDHITKGLGFTNEKVSFSKFSYCEANRMQFYVFDPSGYVYACPETVGQPEMAIGKYSESLVLDDSKVNVWNGRSVFRIPKCRECEIAPLCGGGCAYAAVKTNGNIDDPVCNGAKEVLSEYIYSIKDTILERFA